MISLEPKLNEHDYVFCSSDEPLDRSIKPLATFSEKEGMTYILRSIDADKFDIIYQGKWAWISLDYFSDLAMVGLTAIFSSALGKHGISCNVVAAFHHDHIFVPVDKSSEAMRVLSAIRI